MKLPILKKYWDEIESGAKDFELRDAHITFIDADTGELLGVREIKAAAVVRGMQSLYPDVLEDQWTLFMQLKKREE